MYLGGMHHNSTIEQHMPKERYFTKPEFTLTEFCIQLMFTQSFEDYTQMFSVIFLILRINQDIIYKYHHELVQFGHEHQIHQVHEVRGGIGQVE
jgi:hypothetical protein